MTLDEHYKKTGLKKVLNFIRPVNKNPTKIYACELFDSFIFRTVGSSVFFLYHFQAPVPRAASAKPMSLMFFNSNAKIPTLASILPATSPPIVQAATSSMSGLKSAYLLPSSKLKDARTGEMFC